MLTLEGNSQTEANTLAYSLQGNIDAHAAESLKSLYGTPPSALLLDFKGVQRVNSMGLALLLKLFEHGESQGQSIKVVNANRMTAMLFKMTKLERFLADKPAAAVVNHDPLPTFVHAPPEPIRATQTTAQSQLGKLNFLANLQNSGQLNGWYFFNTYLQRHLQREIHLDLVHAAWDNELRPSRNQLVFAQPFQATLLALEYGFKIVARPTDLADEVTILARAEDERKQLSEFAGATVVTASAQSFVYLLGRFLLDEAGLHSNTLQYRFSGHEIKAIRNLTEGDADLLFLSSENFKSLSSLTRRRLRVLEETDSGLAFHAFCLAPEFEDCSPLLLTTLTEMAVDGKGQQVLKDLGFTGWNQPENEEIEMLSMIYQRYVEPS